MVQANSSTDPPTEGTSPTDRISHPVIATVQVDTHSLSRKQFLLKMFPPAYWLAASR